MIILTVSILYRLSCLVQEQTSLKTYLLDSGCTYLFDYEYDFNEKNGRIPNWVRPSPPSHFVRIIRTLFGGEKIVYIGLHNLNETQLSDTLYRISNLQDLQHIHIKNCRVTKYSIYLLGKNDNLKVIDFKYTSLSETDRNLISKIFSNDTILLFSNDYQPSINKHCDCP
jgi:hypothetical protein